jgi:uncharacterized protein YaaN involved in tellurite resistance
MTNPDAGAAAAAPAPLIPPSGMATLTLEAPPAPQAVPATVAPRMAPPVTAEQRPVLDAKVDQFLAAVTAERAKSPEFEAQAAAVRSMGDLDVQKAAEQSNRMLETPVKQIDGKGLSDSSQVGKTLLELRRTIEDLDPSQAEKAGHKILGIFPFGKGLEDYFRKYQNSQQHLNAILHALRQGQDELTKDNVALNMEKQQLWTTMSRLNQYIYISEQLDTKLSAHIAELQANDPEKAKALGEDVLFYVRQKHQDLLTQLAVSIQGYLAIDIIIKNNLELIKGVDRASTTTISALRTAVIVAQALGNQKLVLDQITALNETTSGLIERTSEMLKTNSAKIQEQAASSTIQLESLQKAFANVYETMDTIDAFKAQALHNMSQTIGVLEAEVEKSRSYLARVSRSEVNAKQVASLDVSDLKLG